MVTSAPEAEARLRNAERAASLCSTLGRNFARAGRTMPCPDFPLITVAFEAVFAEITSPKR